MYHDFSFLSFFDSTKPWLDLMHETSMWHWGPPPPPPPVWMNNSINTVSALVEWDLFFSVSFCLAQWGGGYSNMLSASGWDDLFLSSVLFSLSLSLPAPGQSSEHESSRYRCHGTKTTTLFVVDLCTQPHMSHFIPLMPLNEGPDWVYI